MRNLFKLKNHENQRGVAAVEFAIVLPLMTILLIGIIEFGIVLYNKQVVTNATREGARSAINDLGTKLNSSQIQNIVYEYASDKLITFGNPLDMNDIAVSSSNNNVATREFPDDVTVELTFEHAFVIPGFLGLGPSINIGSITIMKMM
jgi:Flp pilus assembly protein TadG